MHNRLRALSNILNRAYSQVGGVKKPGSSPTSTSANTGKINADVPGLSSKCVKPASGPVGPGASHNSSYKVPEYFSFNRFSYAEAELEMAKYRLPQPSAVSK